MVGIVPRSPRCIYFLGLLCWKASPEDHNPKDDRELPRPHWGIDPHDQGLLRRGGLEVQLSSQPLETSQVTCAQEAPPGRVCVSVRGCYCPFLGLSLVLGSCSQDGDRGGQGQGAGHRERTEWPCP